MTTLTMPSQIDGVAEHCELRIDLAAAFRIAAAFGWVESVGNHFSAAVDTEGKKFLINPKWQHFSAINAGDLLLLDAERPQDMSGPNAPDLSAWAIHSRIHANMPSAKCIVHLHTPYATALSTLEDPTLYPICGNTARFYNRVAYDCSYEGVANEASEGERLCKVIGGKDILLMGNHGVLVAAPTVAAAFEDMYFFEKACQTLMLAYSTGKKIRVLSDSTAAATVAGWEPYAGMAPAHFTQLKQQLDAAGSTYKNFGSKGSPQPIRF